MLFHCGVKLLQTKKKRSQHFLRMKMRLAAMRHSIVTVEENDWQRYKRIPINAFYKSRKSRATTSSKSSVIPQGAIRTRADTYITATHPRNTIHSTKSNDWFTHNQDFTITSITQSELGSQYSSKGTRDLLYELDADDHYYWKSTLMDII